jgi:sugar phosphate permease
MTSERIKKVQRQIALVWMFVPLGLFFLLSQFYRTSSAVIAIDLMHDLQLNAQTLGLLSSIFFYAFALVQLPMGAAMDLFGAKRTLVILALVGFFGAVLFASAKNLAMAMMGRALIGVGMACGLMGTLKLLVNWYPENAFGTASGMILSVGTLGVIAATAPLAEVVARVGWRAAFYGMSACHLVIVVWIVFKVREAPEKTWHEDKSASSHKKFADEVASTRDFLLVFKHPSFWLISATTFVRYGTYVAISGLWAGPFLREIHHFSLIKSGNYLLAFPLGFIIGGPVIGYLSDKILKSRQRVVVFGMAGYSLMMLPLCIAAESIPNWLLLASFAGMGFFTSSGGIMYANIKELLPKRISGLAMTGVNFFTMMGAASFQYGIGTFIKHLSGTSALTPQAFYWGFRLCFMASIIGVVCYLFVKEAGVTKNIVNGGNDID